MIAAHSLEILLEHVRNDLRKQVVERFVSKPSTRLDYMNFGRELHSEITKVKVDEGQLSKLIGILFCSPESELGKNEIVPHLNYFHVRSSYFVDFFCAGYGAYWSNEEYKDKEFVRKIAGIDWLYSPSAYDAFRKEIESAANWEYSGETDLILVTAKRIESGVYLDFPTAIVCNLEELKRIEAITSVRSFFEKIFRFGENFTNQDPVYRLSDVLGVEAGKSFLKEAVLSMLPINLDKFYKKAAPFAIRDISTRQSAKLTKDNSPG